MAAILLRLAWSKGGLIVLGLLLAGIVFGLQQARIAWAEHELAGARHASAIYAQQAIALTTANVAFAQEVKRQNDAIAALRSKAMHLAQEAAAAVDAVHARTARREAAIPKNSSATGLKADNRWLHDFFSSYSR